jgi:flagellar biosynthesis/type III secretory pathway M-ring protein FliF/YscJ
MGDVSQQGIGQDVRKSYVSALSKTALIILMIVGASLFGLSALFIYFIPTYKELYQSAGLEESTLIATELQKNNIPYKYDNSTGTISVPSTELQIARIVLLRKGLLVDGELAQTSLNETNVRHTVSKENIPGFPNQVLEGELAKSIASIDYVQSARVHLALGGVASEELSKDTRASVVVRLYPGRRLSETQIASISHLIASSVANLSLENITIIDQSGNLLKSAGKSNPRSLTDTKFGYARQVEQSYLDKIESTLVPILGPNTIRTHVAVDIDSKYSDLSNTEKGGGNRNPNDTELIQRLYATVIVDNRLVKNGNGQLIQEARSADEMKRITDLVKHAVGFDAGRGDSVSVTNEPFYLLLNNNMSMSTIWQRLWNNDAKWLLVAGLITAIFIVLALQSKRSTGKPHAKSDVANGGVTSTSPDTDKQSQLVKSMDNSEEPDAVDEKTTYEQSMKRARQLVLEEPKVVAQIVKSWVNEGG